MQGGEARRGLTRRQVLIGGATVGAAAALGVATTGSPFIANVSGGIVTAGWVGDTSTTDVSPGGPASTGKQRCCRQRPTASVAQAGGVSPASCEDAGRPFGAVPARPRPRKWAT